MTPEWLLTWASQTLALVALAGLAVRVPLCRMRAAARQATWSATLVLSTALLGWPLLDVASAAGAGAVAASAAAAGPFAPMVVPAPAARLWPWVAWTWAAGAAAALALVARDVIRLLRLKRRTRPLSHPERLRLGAVMGLAASTRGARVCWCDHLDTPAVLGFTRPVIAVPRVQACRLTDEQLQHVVLHEIAHVRRRDDWGALAEHVLAAMLWMNPVMHLARHQAAAAREMACDEWVVRRTGSPAAYARCLVEVAGLRSRARRVRFAAAVTGRAGMLRRRIVSVLAFDGRRPARAVALLAWLAPVAVCMAAAGLLRLPPVFVVAETPVAVVAEALGGVAAGASAPAIVASAPARATATPAPMPRRSAPSRRGARRLDEPVQPDVQSGQRHDEPLPSVPAEAHVGLASPEPLAANALPGAGSAGVLAAGSVAGTVPADAGPRDGWWSGPRELGAATGGAAATAGRATAAFFKRVGSSVPKLITQ